MKDRSVKTIPSLLKEVMSAATVVYDNSLIVAGGAKGWEMINQKPIGSTTVQCYDFSTGAWTIFPSLQKISCEPGYRSACVYNGKMIVFGGRSPSFTEVYDPSTKTWVVLEPPVSPFELAPTYGGGICIFDSTP